MKTSLIVLSIVLFGMHDHAAAEGGCPAGMIPYSGTSTSSCGPIPSGPSGSWLPTAKWKNRWGAVAGDDARGVIGAVTDLPSKREAKQAAIDNCRSRGGVDCTLTVAYVNQCVVIVASTTRYAAVHAESAEIAAEMGMKSCEKKKDGECRLYYAGCSLPVRVR
ncbi:DUF4189 domain-containing protein [Lysobacter sp. CA196]|uniref:DUF4189 domain-containing protein n=1 Tax=Lysobacter sp. CA196 TaxID=3455606 RepID=UPI003F8D4DDC